MARTFASASTRRLVVTSTPITAYPLTMACWAKPSSVASNAVMMSIDDNSTSNRFCIKTGSGGAAGAYTVTVNSGSAAASANFVDATWGHCCATFTSATARAIYFNGGNKVTTATNLTPTGLTQVEIGNTNGSVYFNGDLAECAIWNAALTDAEVAILGNTSWPVSPLMVRPNALVFYAPLLTGTAVNPEIEIIGGRSLTPSATAPTVAAHPAIHYPARRRKFYKGATVASGDGALSATGTATASLGGASTSSQPASMTGTGTATLAGASTAVSTLAATGTGTATFVGAGIVGGLLSATGIFDGPPVTNLVLRSQELDNAAWTFAAGIASVTANATAAPDSTITAEKLVEAVSAADKALIQTAITIVSGSVYTQSIYVKAGERNEVNLTFLNNDFGGGAFTGVFDLPSETWLSAGGTFGSGATFVERGFANTGGGWYRVWITGSLTTTSARVSYDMAEAGDVNYTGDGTSGLYLWGAQLELGPVATPYIATTSASVTVTRPFVSAATDAKAFSMTGTGTATLVGASQADSALSATGTGTATFVGLEVVTIAPFSMTGTGTGLFTGASDVSAALSATGTGTATLVGAGDVTSAPFSMTGTGTATFVGAPFASGALSATGTGTALFASAATTSQAFSMTGTGTATFVGASTVSSALNATGIANVSFAGAKTVDAILAATGTWTATFSYASAGEGALAATGTATALLAGASDVSGTLSATGAGDATFVGEGVQGATDAVLDCTGTGTAAFVGAFAGGVTIDGGGYDVGANASRLRQNAQKKKRKKKDALNELDQLLLDLRGQIAPWQKAKAYETEQALYRDALARGKALDESDTLAKIESEIVNLKELLAEIDEEEAVMLLLM